MAWSNEKKDYLKTTGKTGFDGCHYVPPKYFPKEEKPKEKPKDEEKQHEKPEELSDLVSPPD